ncbi:MAG: SsrA-binding protein [Rhodothermales bacterium]|jgi:SsrA-binding protein
MSEATKTIVSNRKAWYEYHIQDQVEAGLVLTGTEIKSLRTGKANLQEAFCSIRDGEMFLLQCHIAPYDFGNIMNHEPLRPRKLLLHKKEIERFAKSTTQKGYTIIPLRLYFKDGRAKLEIGLGKGKKLYDKRADTADRDSKRRLDRIRKGGSDD